MLRHSSEHTTWLCNLVTSLTPQRLQVEGAVFDDPLDGHHRAGDDTSGTRQLYKQPVADLQRSMLNAVVWLGTWS